MAVQVPLAGSYSSARAVVPLVPNPPETRTIPSGSKVAVWPKRAVLRLPVAVQVPFAGSVHLRARGNAADVIPPCNQDCPVGQQGRRVE